MHVENEDKYAFYEPKRSEWECELFGMKGQITVCPNEDQVPNWFWRTMQYLVFGNKWTKVR